MLRAMRWPVAAVAATVAVLLTVGGGVLLASTTGDDGSGAPGASIVSTATDTAAGTSTIATTATPTTEAAASTSDASTTVVPTSVATTTAAPTTAAPTTSPATTAPVTTAPATTAPRTTTPRTTVAATTIPATVAPTTPPTAPPAPGAVVLSNATIDLGATTGSVSFEVRNPGGQPIGWALAGNAGEFTISQLGGTVGPGGATTVTVALDRSGRPEGDLQRSVTVTGDPGGPQLMVLRARVEHAPSVKISVGPSGTNLPACQLSTFVSASYSDESAIASMTLRWDGPVSGSMQMGVRTAGTAVGNLFAASTNAPPIGSYTYTVIITDVRGNTGTAGGSFSTQIC